MLQSLQVLTRQKIRIALIINADFEIQGLWARMRKELISPLQILNLVANADFCRARRFFISPQKGRALIFILSHFFPINSYVSIPSGCRYLKSIEVTSFAQKNLAKSGPILFALSFICWDVELCSVDPSNWWQLR